MPPKFIPGYVKPDGTLYVVTKFKTAQDAANLRDPVTAFCVQWVEERKDWQLGKDMRIDQGPGDYLGIFIGPPNVVKVEGNELWLRFDARVYSYWWRDWFVMMLSGLRGAFPELEREPGISTNCDE